jgi:hypothetical protein
VPLPLISSNPLLKEQEQEQERGTRNKRQSKIKELKLDPLSKSNNKNDDEHKDFSGNHVHRKEDQFKNGSAFFYSLFTSYRRTLLFT